MYERRKKSNGRGLYDTRKNNIKFFPIRTEYDDVDYNDVEAIFFFFFTSFLWLQNAHALNGRERAMDDGGANDDV